MGTYITKAQSWSVEILGDGDRGGGVPATQEAVEDALLAAKKRRVQERAEGDLGFGVWGLGFGVWGLGFRV